MVCFWNATVMDLKTLATGLQISSHESFEVGRVGLSDDRHSHSAARRATRAMSDFESELLLVR